MTRKACEDVGTGLTGCEAAGLPSSSWCASCTAKMAAGLQSGGSSDTRLIGVHHYSGPAALGFALACAARHVGGVLTAINEVWTLSRHPAAHELVAEISAGAQVGLETPRALVVMDARAGLRLIYLDDAILYGCCWRYRPRKLIVSRPDRFLGVLPLVSYLVRIYDCSDLNGLRTGGGGGSAGSAIPNALLPSDSGGAKLRTRRSGQPARQRGALRRPGGGPAPASTAPASSAAGSSSPPADPSGGGASSE